MVVILPNKRPVYWECMEDGHSKFWAATIQSVARTTNVNNKEVDKTSYIILRRWGLIGTEGQKMEQEFEDRYEAEKALDKLIWEKESKGYKSVF